VQRLLITLNFTTIEFYKENQMPKYYAGQSIYCDGEAIVDGVNLSQCVFMIDTENKEVGVYVRDNKGETIINEEGTDVVRTTLKFEKLRLTNKENKVMIEIGYEAEDFGDLV
jgi:hypothetical protein